MTGVISGKFLRNIFSVEIDGEHDPKTPSWKKIIFLVVEFSQKFLRNNYFPHRTTWERLDGFDSTGDMRITRISLKELLRQTKGFFRQADTTMALMGCARA